MIVVENRIAELINLLPNVGGLKPVYHYGEGIELNKFLLGRNGDGNHTFPLVYQVSYNDVPSTRAGESKTKWKALLATSTRPELYNTEREATTYANILYPLFGLIEQVFRKSGSVLSDYQWSSDKMPNYSREINKEEHGFLDVVDVLYVECDIIVKDGCFNSNIFFN